MAEEFDGPWEIYQPPELDPQLEALTGKGAGLRKTLALLSQNPCHPDVGGYRLSGPLATVVCGAHLKRGYRIAYTTQPALTADDRPRVVVLYVGKREPRHSTPSDLWDVVTTCSASTTRPPATTSRRAARTCTPRSTTTRSRTSARHSRS